MMCQKLRKIAQKEQKKDWIRSLKIMGLMAMNFKSLFLVKILQQAVSLNGALLHSPAIKSIWM